MKPLSVLCLCAAFLVTLGQSQAVTTLVWQDSFDSGISIGATGTTSTYINGSAITTEIIANPHGSGNVLRYTDKAGTMEWGSELRKDSGSTSGTVLLSTVGYGYVAGASTYSFTFDYYLPSNTSAKNDQFGFMIRFTATSAAGGSSLTSSHLLLSDTVVKDQWVTVNFTGNIPALTNATDNFAPVLYVTPMLVWNDRPFEGAYNSTLTPLGYVDNISFSISPEPGRALLLCMAGMAVLMRRRKSCP